MKIGQISHLYRPNPGGVENYVYRLKNSLERRGHEITVYTTDLSIRGTAEREKGAFYCKTNFAIYRNPFSSELLQKLRESREDIYHLHGPWFFSSLFATRLLKGRPKIMTVHGARIEGWGPAIFALNKLYYPFARYILKNMHMTIALTKGERDHLLRRFKLSPKRVIVIPNGIEIDKYPFNKDATEKFIEKNHLKKDSFKVLYVGRFVPQKNPDKLIFAMKRMKGQNVEAILIGEGPKRYISKLKKISGEQVHILTKVGFEEIVAAYHVSHLFTLLSPSEGLPTVILEAMLCGMPILTTPVGGIPDVVAEGVNGLYLDVPVKEEDVADKINRFMDMSKSDRNRMGRTNIKKIRTHYDWEIVADKILELYNQVLE